MTILLFANNVKTTLAAPITNTSTTITVAPGTGSEFPSPTTGQSFIITFVDAATGLIYEIASCTTRSGDTLTVVRGQEGTTAVAWNSGDTIAMFPTAGTMQNFAQLSGATFTGAVSATTLTSSGLLTANTAYLPGGFIQVGSNSPGANTIFKFDATLSTNYGANYYPIARGDSGTYNLSITGNAATATTATNQSGGTVNATSVSSAGNITSGGNINSNGGIVQAGNSAGTYAQLNYYGQLNLSSGGGFQQIVTANQFPAYFGGTNGYQKLPNGLIIQWGTQTIPTGNADPVYFNISFPNACLNITTSDTGTPGSPSSCLSTGHTDIYSGYFIAFSRNPGTGSFAACNYSFIAIGY